MNDWCPFEFSDRETPSGRYSQQRVGRRDLLSVGGGKCRCTPSTEPRFCAAWVKEPHFQFQSDTHTKLFALHEVKERAGWEDTEGRPCAIPRDSSAGAALLSPLSPFCPRRRLRWGRPRGCRPWGRGWTRSACRPGRAPCRLWFPWRRHCRAPGSLYLHRRLANCRTQQLLIRDRWALKLINPPQKWGNQGWNLNTEINYYGIY